MNDSMFSRLMKRVFAGEYAAMQREHDIDITAFPLQPTSVPMVSTLSAPLVQRAAVAQVHPSQRATTAH